MLINITGTSDLDFEDVDKASEIITSAAHPDATIIWGAAFDETLGDTLCVTVIATGLVSDGSYQAKQPEGTPLSSFGQKVDNAAAKDDDIDFGELTAIFNRRREN